MHRPVSVFVNSSFVGSMHEVVWSRLRFPLGKEFQWHLGSFFALRFNRGHVNEIFLISVVELDPLGRVGEQSSKLRDVV